MRGNAFFHRSIVKQDIISSVVAVIRKLERAEKSAEGLVGMKYEMRQWSTAVTLRLSRLSREDIRQLFRLEQIRFACCIQSSSYRRLKEVAQLISCNNTFDPRGSQGFQKQTSDVLHFRSFEGNGWMDGWI